MSGWVLGRFAVQGFMFCQPWRQGWSALGFLTTMALGAAGGTGKETFRVLKRGSWRGFRGNYLASIRNHTI